MLYSNQRRKKAKSKALLVETLEGLEPCTGNDHRLAPTTEESLQLSEDGVEIFGLKKGINNNGGLEIN